MLTALRRLHRAVKAAADKAARGLRELEDAQKRDCEAAERVAREQKRKDEEAARVEAVECEKYRKVKRMRWKIGGEKTQNGELKRSSKPQNIGRPNRMLLNVKRRRQLNVGLMMRKRRDKPKSPNPKRKLLTSMLGKVRHFNRPEYLIRARRHLERRFLRVRRFTLVSG